MIVQCTLVIPRITISSVNVRESNIESALCCTNLVMSCSNELFSQSEHAAFQESFIKGKPKWREREVLVYSREEPRARFIHEALFEVVSGSERNVAFP